jgi:hypothetical protein
VKVFRKGAVVKFQSAQIPDEGAELVERKRGIIRDQSTVSRKRAAHAFGNAECDWIAMLCLTWHHMPPPKVVKAAWRAFREWWKGEFGEIPDAWIMEMQERGAPHFHLFIARQSNVGGLVCAALQAGAIEVAEKGSPRGGTRTRRLVRTKWVEKIGRAWCECALQDYSAEALWWHTERGIVEIVESADAAGRYVAKECAKREQKVLPDHYAEGLGRWWYLARRWAPVERIEADVADIQATWPWDWPVKYVWDARDIAQTISALTVLPQDGKDVSHIQAAAAEIWSEAKSQKKSPTLSRVEIQAQRDGWHREDMQSEMLCGTVADDGIICRAWARWDEDIASYICQECAAIHMGAPRACAPGENPF